MCDRGRSRWSKEPLETEVLKEWEQDPVVCRVMRYQVGVFKGAPAKVAEWKRQLLDLLASARAEDSDWRDLAPQK